MSKITNDGLTPVWRRMFYSGTRVATVSVKGLRVDCKNAAKMSTQLSATPVSGDLSG